jgi:hypothetical protein
MILGFLVGSQVIQIVLLNLVLGRLREPRKQL